MLRVALLLLISISLVAGCNRKGTRNADTERELPFNAKFSKGDDPREIEVRVQNKGAGVEAVRESVRFEATKYCLINFGGSDADWRIDPVSNDWAFTQDGDSLTFFARCTAR